jgi:hypothetical protein
MVLRSDITWAGPLACLLVCLLALRQPLVQSCIPCAQRNLQRYHPVKPARLGKHPWQSVCSSRHSPTRPRSEHISARGQRLHPPAPVRSTRTQHVGSRQHDAENCNRPALDESTPQSLQYPARHGRILPRRRSRRAIHRSLRPHLSLPQAIRRPLVGGMVAVMAA